MKKIVFLSIIIISCGFKFGSNTAYLTCKSDSGRTVFNAEIQDISGILYKAELTVDNIKMSYKTDEGHVIFDPKNGVFTMYIKDKTDKEYTNHKYLEFWSIPSTFNTLKNNSEDQIYEFKAKIYGTEPRKNKEFHIPEITLNCKLEYSI